MLSFKITIKPSNRELVAESSETILDAALREGLALPNGCRNGTCGGCKGKVLEGSVDHGSYSPQALSEADLVAGMTLFCCAKPLSDVTIETRAIGATKNIVVKIMPCRVEKIDKPVPDVAILWLKLPAGERLQFLAGQYIEILLKDGKRRAFSLANAPHEEAFLQLHVRHVPGGAFTDILFGGMQEKAILRFEGPHGTFFLHEDSDKPMVLMATGTGFAPLKAILEHAFHSGLQRPMTLYWGARTPGDLYLLDLPRQWERQYANFKFVPVISDPQPDDGWQGRSGYVTHAVLDDFADLSGVQVYASGAPAMVMAARALFVEQRGLPQEAFFSDAFVFAGSAK